MTTAPKSAVTSTNGPPSQPRRVSKAVLLVILSALGALVTTVVGGLLVYRTTNQLKLNDGSVDHSRVVIEAILLEIQYVDRVENTTRLYQLTRADDTYTRTLRSVASLEEGAAHLQLLVDNHSQAVHVREFMKALHDLSVSVEHPRSTQAAPELQVEECRRILGSMQVDERNLLDQRIAELESSRMRSIATAVSYWILSKAILVLILVLMAREALKHQTSATKADLVCTELQASLQTLGLVVEDAALLKCARDELQLCVSAEQAYICAAHHFELILPGSSGMALSCNGSKNILVIAAKWQNPPELRDGSEPDSCCALRAGRRRWRKPGQSAIDCTHFTGSPPENYVCIPLTALGETFGVMSIALPAAAAAPVSERRVGLSYELAELASMAIAGLNLRAKTENQSIRDGLTQLFNRNFMEFALDRELHRAARRGSELALLMLDVDHFKFFNDTFGHEAGDVILRDLANSFQASVRTEDIVCRFGGEEFVIILPEITREEAWMRAEAIRRTVAEKLILFRGDPLRKISISIGIAIFPNPARDAADLLRIADRAMYEAKHGGRNQVRICLDEMALLPAIV